MTFTDKHIGERVIYHLYDYEKNYGIITAITDKNKITIRLDNLNQKSTGKIIQCEENEIVLDYQRDADFQIIID